MYNAYSVGRVRLYRVWGEDTFPAYVDLDPGTRLMVVYSPTLRQYVASITSVDTRYDALVQPQHFQYDSSLLPVLPTPDAATSALNRIRSS
jgi:hypothetical protein